MRLGRRLDMAAGRDDERRALLRQPVGERPDPLPVLELDVDDGEVEAAGLDPLDRFLDRIAGADHVVTESLEEILEHHRDQRLVLDDQDRPFAHARCLSVCFGKEKYYLVAAVPLRSRSSTSRTVSASCCTEKGLARNETLGMSIELRSCSSA